MRIGSWAIREPANSFTCGFDGTRASLDDRFAPSGNALVSLDFRNIQRSRRRYSVSLVIFILFIEVGCGECRGREMEGTIVQSTTSHVDSAQVDRSPATGADAGSLRALRRGNCRTGLGVP